MHDNGDVELTIDNALLADTARRLVLQFSEVPGLSLTVSQAGRLINVDCKLCHAALEHLLAAGWLTRADDGQFRRPATLDLHSSPVKWWLNTSQKPSAPTRLTHLSAREAFAAILIAAARADGTVSATEADRIEQVLSSMRMYRDCDRDALRPLIRELIQVVAVENDPVVVHAAAAAIPRHLGACVMALAADIVLSDGRVRPGEHQFLGDLQRELSLDDRMTRTIFDVMLMKNSA
jgi:hypothetical protein